MKTTMVAREADTFVALAQAVALARAEGAVDAKTSSSLSAGFVAGLLTGCMEMETYGQIHDALARLLEKAFEKPERGAGSPVVRASATPEAEGSLEVYLEVVEDAWSKLSWEEETCGRLKAFARKTFDMGRATFGEGAWFRAPLRTDLSRLVREARSAGLLIVSMEGQPPGGATEAALRDPSAPAARSRVVRGWGERRVALDLVPAGSA
jgi:hypothetical protein